MDDDLAFEYLCYVLGNAEIHPYPFPHFFVRDVFPYEIYTKLLNSLPLDAEYETKEEINYHGRRFGSVDNIPLRKHFLSHRFTKLIASLFRPWLPQSDLQVTPELRLVRDGCDYQIGPHTDAPWKIFSLLFYLPEFGSAETFKPIGTSIYVPRDPTFRCIGGPHHSYDLFYHLHTFPFAANSCLGFIKTDHSFHGVEPIQVPVRRDILLWNLHRAKDPMESSQQKQVE